MFRYNRHFKALGFGTFTRSHIGTSHHIGGFRRNRADHLTVYISYWTSLFHSSELGQHIQARETTYVNNTKKKNTTNSRTKKQEHKRTRRAMDSACRAQSCDDVIVSPFHQLTCKALKFESNATHASRLNPKQSRRTDGRVRHQTNP